MPQEEQHNRPQRSKTFEKLTGLGKNRRPTIRKEDISRPLPLEFDFENFALLTPTGSLSPASHVVATPVNSAPLNPASETSPTPSTSKSSFKGIQQGSFERPRRRERQNLPRRDRDIGLRRLLSDPAYAHAYPIILQHRPCATEPSTPLTTQFPPIFTTPPPPNRAPPPVPSNESFRKRLRGSTLVADSVPDRLLPLTVAPEIPRHSADEHTPLKIEPPTATHKLLEPPFQLSLSIERLERKKSRDHAKSPLFVKIIAQMESSRLQPPVNAGTKARAVQQAKEMEKLVADRAKRKGDEPPPYDFYELIGKGAYGRVFKGCNQSTGGLVAIKIIDIDKVDYEEMTTKNLQETLKEINILQQLKDSKARPYVNIIEEARNVHNELWIISEYASGGSVNTLMKPTLQLSKSGLEEKYIIPIARELAMGLRFIHEAGVLHRDLKCNNILILEDGRVQLCDFGVSGALEPEISKRSTIVGTPFWMAPEIHKEWVKEADPKSTLRPREILYGSEVDIWAYGCTIYEMATGYPPFHETTPLQLHEAGIPRLEGPKFSDQLKDLVSFVFKPNPQERPTAEQILAHPYLFDTTKLLPTKTLVQLVKRYYEWEYAGGSRVSLFNPYGAQAPDPLAPEDDEEDNDWTFSTTDEFEKQFAQELTDPFRSDALGQAFAGINAPPVDDSRFAQLRARMREEQADRGAQNLNRLFDKNSTPYKYSGIDSGPGRPPSDLVLRDFNPGAPNRETVIDLDFAAPTTADIPSIDLGEVPTVKANRINRMLREMDIEDEERDSFDMDQTARRATKDWKFPTMAEQTNRRTMEWNFPTIPEKPNRKTMEWTFDASMQEKPNRKTMEWTFDASMAEANQDSGVKVTRLSRRRDTQEPSLPVITSQVEDSRRTRDFVFPPREAAEGGSLSDQGPRFSSSPTLGPGFRPSLRHATTEPLETFDDYLQVNSAPDSPLRASIIDLDMAMVDEYRPSTSGSASTSTYTAGTETLNGNPFDLEDQVHLSQTNNRASYHMKSQSEPNQAIPGLLTPQTYDERGYPVNQDSNYPNMHARGISSVSQMQAKVPPHSIGYARQRPQQQTGDGWNHQAAYNLDESPPASTSTSTSAEEEDIDELWDALERQNLQAQRRGFPGFRSRRTASQDEDPRSETEDNYASEYDELTVRASRVSVGPNGNPLVDFPIPRGPDAEIFVGLDTDPVTLNNALWKGTQELSHGIRASKDLLKAMKLASVQLPDDIDSGSK